MMKVLIELSFEKQRQYLLKRSLRDEAVGEMFYCLSVVSWLFLSLYITGKFAAFIN